MSDGDNKTISWTAIAMMVLAGALCLLAAAIAYFAAQVPGFNRSLEQASFSVDGVSPQIPAIVSAINDVSEQIPTILEEVSAVRQSVAAIIAESEQYSKTLPQVREGVDNISAQVADIEQTLPDIYQRVDAVVAATQGITAELNQWQPRVQALTEQLEYSRTDIPRYLTRAENLVEDAGKLGQEASSGVVTGLVKGVISLPVQVLGGVGNLLSNDTLSARRLSDEDKEVLFSQIYQLLNDDKLQQVTWQNPDSGNSGTITRLPAPANNDKPCAQLRISNRIGRQQETIEQVVCREDDGQWVVRS